MVHTSARPVKTNRIDARNTFCAYECAWHAAVLGVLGERFYAIIARTSMIGGGV